MYTIREVDTNEAEALQEVARDTFVESFGKENTKANMETYLSERFTLEQVQEELGHPESSFFFSQTSGEIAGYLKTNVGSAQTENILDSALEIERIYVISKFQGQKVGWALFEKAVEVAKSQNLERIWLGVWDMNEKAIGFYKKLGFEEFSSHPFMLGIELQTDIMMKLELD